MLQDVLQNASSEALSYESNIFRVCLESAFLKLFILFVLSLFFFFFLKEFEAFVWEPTGN